MEGIAGEGDGPAVDQSLTLPGYHFSSYQSGMNSHLLKVLEQSNIRVTSRSNSSHLLFHARISGWIQSRGLDRNNRRKSKMDGAPHNEVHMPVLLNVIRRHSISHQNEPLGA